MFFLRLFFGGGCIRASTFFFGGGQRVKHKRDISFLFVLLLSNSMVSISIQPSTTWTLALLAGRDLTHVLCWPWTLEIRLECFFVFKNNLTKSFWSNPTIHFQVQKSCLVSGRGHREKISSFQVTSKNYPKKLPPQKNQCFAPRFWWLVTWLPNVLRGTLESRSGGTVFDIPHSFNIKIINFISKISTKKTSQKTNSK